MLRNRDESRLRMPGPIRILRPASGKPCARIGKSKTSRFDVIKEMENGIGVPQSAGNLAHVRVQRSSIHRPTVALRRHRWKHHVEIVHKVGKMNTARARIARLQNGIRSNVLLPTTPSPPRTDRGEVNYRILLIQRGWMCYLHRMDPMQSPLSVQNRASSDSRRKDPRSVGLLMSAMADSRLSLVLRSGPSLLHNQPQIDSQIGPRSPVIDEVSRMNRLPDGAWRDSTSDWRVKRRWLVLQEAGK
jgi:hypothetical protein